MKANIYLSILCLSLTMLSACSKKKNEDSAKQVDSVKDLSISQPLVSHIYTADPSAHVFNDRIYIYPSHDIEAGTPENDNGDHFDMRDYHILSMDSIGGEVTDHGVAIDIKNIPWAGRQLWAPDAAYANNTYYLYFPVKDKEDIFRIGVATSTKPEGPFIAEPKPITNSYSIDPAVFKDDDGAFYMLPRVAKLSSDMKQFAEEVKEVKLVDENGNLFTESQNDKRFFEAAWMHKFNGKYYFTYSTGDTHFINYAIGDSPYGPFTYKGVVLHAVQGWTNHHSIVEIKGKWYLFYHDVQLSGKTHLRNVKVTELKHNEDGSIEAIKP
ncbi:MAG: alpha-N-arabinofuranosidase [Cytophagia bacterium]|nr:alpha-N-arabinofuranosidase [Cytophagia bacterium]